ncbi:MAG: LysR family transcriptional regulator [Rhodopila sp.]|nr:LysR family transcriptional regulator [Rhodopila sp.]
MLDLITLREFSVLVEELNFRRAASRLGISQPALTRHVHRLEQELGTHLFERHQNGIRPTQAGDTLAEWAGWLSHEFIKIKADISEARGGLRGHLAVGFITSLSAPVLLRALATFRSLEKLHLELYEGTDRQQIYALRQHRIDVALVIGAIYDLSLNVETLWTERLVAILPPDHPLREQEVAAWSDLSGEQLVVRAADHDHWIAEFVAGLAAKAGCHPQIEEFTASRESVIGLIRAGFGVAVLPESSILSVNTTELVCRPIIGPGSTFEVVGVWLPENANPVLRRFLEQVTLAVREAGS